MKKGYVIVTKDYKAEVCEFSTLKIMKMPDESVIYRVMTKHGVNCYYESDLSEDKESLEKTCEELNKSLEYCKGGVTVK